MSFSMSVGQLLEYSLSLPDEPKGNGPKEIRHDVASTATQAAKELVDGLSINQLWRYAVLQLLDDYISTSKRAGTHTARRMFDKKPELTGSKKIDAALAGLCAWLADRDGWNPPDWISDADRFLPSPWFPDDNRIFHDEAYESSPLSFSNRNIHVRPKALSRA